MSRAYRGCGSTRSTYSATSADESIQRYVTVAGFRSLTLQPTLLGQVTWRVHVGQFLRIHRHLDELQDVERCRQVLDELDRPYIVASLSLSLSRIALQAGDLVAAQEHIDRALRVARDTGNQLDLVHFLLQLGAVEVGLGEFATALAAFQEAAAVAQDIHAENLLVEVETGLADRTAAMDKRAAREVTVTFRP